MGRSMCSWLCTSLGFREEDLKSWSGFVHLLNRPTDPASLAVFRILFGLLMVLDIPQERGLASLDKKYPPPPICHFPLFHDFQPPPIDFLYLTYLLMFIGAVGILLGACFRVSALLFTVTYWFIFTLDKTTWNNHSYLYGIFGLLLSLTNSHHAWSVDGLIVRGGKRADIPLWNYTVVRAQVFIVYFIAGLKKLDFDWLAGYSMGKLGSHWLFQPFRLFLSEEMICWLVVHGGGFGLDISAGFLLIFPVTRLLGLVMTSYFHIMNSQLFNIGMFPYAMLASGPLFLAADWPKRLGFGRNQPIRSELCLYPESTVELKRQQGTVDSKVIGRSKLAIDRKDTTKETKGEGGESEERGKNTSIDSKMAGVTQTSGATGGRKKTSMKGASGGGVRWIHRIGAAFTIIYICEQLFLPYSHFISQGYNTWTGGLYGYSWDMMIHSRSHQHVRIMYKDGKTGETGFLKPGVWALTRRWKDHPDMQKQYAACAAHILQTWHDVQEPQIYMDIWSSLNDRFQQRLVDPRVDLVRANWSPLRPAPWLLPLLAQLSPWRQRLRELDAQLSEGEEAVFLADFPGLHLENFITADLKVSIEVLSGSVAVETSLKRGSDENDPENWQNTSLRIGETMKLPSGSYHRVYPLSSEPACYGYISFNQTLADIKHNLTRLISLREAILNGSDVNIESSDPNLFPILQAWQNVGMDVAAY
uniref:vitamin K-dependent gamma-carboxylase isoform X2 n=1 Tax=Myxine glutinosa TaxID=7769 RepID=UPI00358FDD9E